jgi:hypothetical protein
MQNLSKNMSLDISPKSDERQIGESLLIKPNTNAQATRAILLDELSANSCHMNPRVF